MIIRGHRMEIALRLNLIVGIRGVHLHRRCLCKRPIDLLSNLGARNIRRRRAIRVVLDVDQARIHEGIVHARNVTSLSGVSGHKGSALESLTHGRGLREDIVQHNRHDSHQRNRSQVIRLARGCQQQNTELHSETEDRVQSLSHTHVRQRNKVLPVGGCEQPRRVLKPEHFVHLLVESPEFFSRTFF